MRLTPAARRVLALVEADPNISQDTRDVVADLRKTDTQQEDEGWTNASTHGSTTGRNERTGTGRAT